ncbi:MAG: flagellar basal body-associated FliL family protein [Thermoleophilia bacterium]|nr:flagellar basal body-associated FliL family protein [Thermoleophilia bacterium]
MKKILGNKKLLIIIILVPVIAAVVLKMFVLKPPPPDEKKLAKTPGPVYALSEPFVVNLKADGGTPHFAKLGIALRVSELSAAMVPPAEGAEGAAMEEEPEIRDIVIATVSKLTPERLLSARGRTEVKHAIRRRVNEDMELKITDVYYTEFAVQ